MTKLKWLCLGGLVFTAQAIAADLSLSAGYWDYLVKGTVERNGITQDFQNDLGVQAERHELLAFALDTGEGWWRPDVSASYTPIKASGQRMVQSGGSVLIPGSTTLVKGDADLKDIDLTLRFPAQLANVTVWGGITIKYLNGTLISQNSSDTVEDNQSINQTFPMFHLSARVAPLSWLVLTAQGNAIKYQDDSANDICAAFSFGGFGPIGLDLGWKRNNYKINQQNFKLDTTLSGLFIGASASLP